METKYKILLGLYSAFMAFFMLIVPWQGKGYNPSGTSFIFSPPSPGASILVEDVMLNLFWINFWFVILYVLVKKLSPRIERWL